MNEKKFNQEKIKRNEELIRELETKKRLLESKNGKSSSGNRKHQLSKTGDIEIIDIKKTFKGKTVLKDVSVKLEPGKVYGFLGNNGAGKTTLMRIIFNMELPDQGRIYYNNIPQKDIDFAEWFYFTETDAVPTNYRVYDYLQELSFLYGISSKEFTKRLAEITDFIEFNFSLKAKISSLSSGQQKIVNCFALLLIKPKIVFLDEPTANMDVWNQKIIMKIIEKMKNENRIIVITTHLLKEIAGTLTDVVILDKGEIRYEGSVTPKTDLQKLFKEHTTDTSDTDFLDVDNPNDVPTKSKKEYDSNSFDKEKIGAYLNE